MSILQKSQIGYNLIINSMQLAHPRGNLIEKIVHDGQGRLVRATFCVYEDNGRIKARLIQAILIEEVPAIQNKILSLANLNPKKVIHSEIVYQSRIISPYFNNNLLYFSGSKPRAPTDTK